MRIMERMMKTNDRRRGRGFRLDSIAFTEAIRAVGRAVQWREALGLFDKMLKMQDAKFQNGEKNAGKNAAEGIRPNIHTFHALLDCLANSGQWEAVVGILESMDRAVVAPDAHIYGHISQALVRLNRWDEAIALAEDMEDKEIRPDRNGEEGTAMAYAAKGEWNRALLCLKHISEILESREWESNGDLRVAKNKESLALARLIKNQPTIVDLSVRVFQHTQQWASSLKLYQLANRKSLHLSDAAYFGAAKASSGLEVKKIWTDISQSQLTRYLLRNRKSILTRSSHYPESTATPLSFSPSITSTKIWLRWTADIGSSLNASVLSGMFNRVSRGQPVGVKGKYFVKLLQAADPKAFEELERRKSAWKNPSEGQNGSVSYQRPLIPSGSHEKGKASVRVNKNEVLALMKRMISNGTDFAGRNLTNAQTLQLQRVYQEVQDLGKVRVANMTLISGCHSKGIGSRRVGILTVEAMLRELSDRLRDQDSILVPSLVETIKLLLPRIVDETGCIFWPAIAHAVMVLLENI
mmetsp:Transcript_19513/g.47651  ORF Transcript_19513/g.47651 Transcript_19513/m.47651 type:complete len:524 (+) Transcript_19513:1392-2963(+)